MTSTPYLTFVERHGSGAEERLAQLAERLRRSGVSSRLVRSRDRHDLRLLVVDGSPQLSDLDLGGAQVWRFADPGHESGGQDAAHGSQP